MLQLGDNLLSGSFPESFSELRKLEWLYMDNAALTGNVPTLPSQEIMSIGFNFLTGTISESSPTFFYKLAMVQFGWEHDYGKHPSIHFFVFHIGNAFFLGEPV
jgi:hypothetical protein